MASGRKTSFYQSSKHAFEDERRERSSSASSGIPGRRLLSLPRTFFKVVSECCYGIRKSFGEDDQLQPNRASLLLVAPSRRGISGRSFDAGRKYLASSRKRSTKDKEDAHYDQLVHQTALEDLIIHPNDRRKRVFDLVVLFSILLSAITLPVKIAFSVDFWSGFFVWVDIIFIIDIVLQFFHGYMDVGFPVMDPRRIARRYVRSWFAVDLISALPFDLIFHEYFRSFTLLKTLRLLRARKLLFMGSLRSSNTLRVALTLAAWLLLAHWAACAFYMIGFYSVCIMGWYNTCWQLAYWEGAVSNQTFCEGNGHLVWMGAEEDDWELDGDNGLLNPLAGNGPKIGITAATRYVRALYWAFATMSSLGYGSAPTPVTDAEYLLGLSCQLMGACVYAAIFGNIAALIAKLAGAASRYQEQLEKMHEFIRFHKLPSALRDKLNAYNDFLFEVNQGFDVNQIAGALPPTLQRELYMQMYEHLVRRVPMFEDCDDSFIEELVQLLKPQVLLAGDCVFRAWEAGDKMYFIQNGAIQICDASLQRVYSTLIEGAYFGELSMLTAQRRTATARALTDCILFYVTIADFEEVIKSYPKHFSEILDRAIKRLEETLHENKGGITGASLGVLREARNAKDRFLKQASQDCTASASAVGSLKNAHAAQQASERQQAATEEAAKEEQRRKAANKRSSWMAVQGACRLSMMTRGLVNKGGATAPGGAELSSSFAPSALPPSFAPSALSPSAAARASPPAARAPGGGRESRGSCRESGSSARVSFVEDPNRVAFPPHRLSTVRDEEGEEEEEEEVEEEEEAAAAPVPAGRGGGGRLTALAGASSSSSCSAKLATGPRPMSALGVKASAAEAPSAGEVREQLTGDARHLAQIALEAGAAPGAHVSYSALARKRGSDTVSGFGATAASAAAASSSGAAAAATEPVALLEQMASQMAQLSAKVDAIEGTREPSTKGSAGGDAPSAAEEGTTDSTVAHV